MPGEYLRAVRENAPIIHSISNFITANDVANVLLAVGASPIMAQEIKEMEEISILSRALNINMGAIDENKLRLILEAGKMYNKASKPIVLDPVGVGATEFRKKAAAEILDNIKIDIIRGNVSEIRALASNIDGARGIDASDADVIEGIKEEIEIFKKLSRDISAIIVITGKTDLVIDESRAYFINNGHPMMKKITGAGCQLDAVIAAFCSVCAKDNFTAAVAAVSMMGVAAEFAYKRMSDNDGNMTFRNYLIDAVYNMTPEILDKYAKIQIYEG